MSAVIKPIYTRFQLSMILGVSSRDILSWMNAGELRAIPSGTATDGRYLGFCEDDIVDFIYRHPESCGRVYCDDSIPVFNSIRSRIVERLEKRNGY